MIAVESIGLTPISPLITELGTVDIPDFARMAKWPARPRSTGAVMPDTIAGLVLFAAKLKAEKVNNTDVANTRASNFFKGLPLSFMETDCVS